METVAEFAQRRRDQVAANIRHYREAAGLSQHALARGLGVDYGQVWRWEHGWHEPKRHIARIAAVLGVTVAQLTEERAI